MTGVQTCALPISKRIDEIAEDPKKRKNFIRGLEIINASSGIKPIGQAKSPLGRSEERRVGKECRSRWSPYH